ncbi:DUF4124 domain-containing protein [uncultured Oxalicibacterium sp.]|uniref:DUF4124 domain-containing protein n=1 Tax=uncultured Oxalicibacterium sp. TaxID=1168540 RepID=UPI0025E66B6B|nr:DUF4124 domain-containing protein [uncultured Oxalicibacterium sp.]
MKIFAARTVAATLLLALCAAQATAQYVWRDEKGTKQYSDMPPPASVPQNRILKAPGMRTPANETGATETPAPTPPAPSSSPSLSERNAEFMKRRSEAAEKEKQAADKAVQDAERKRACQQTDLYRQALESGERISRRTPSGERAYLSDEERAQAIKDTRKQLENCR